MRKEYAKALRTIFERTVKESLPDFQPTNPKSLYLGPGERAFRWSPGAGVECYVILVPSPKDTDEFTIEMAWSTLGRFPELGMRPSGRPTTERSEFENEEFSIRLSNLWTPDDHWWQLSKQNAMDHQLPSMEDLAEQIKPVPAEKARAAVIPQVQDAIRKLKAHGVPYLQEFVDAQTAHSDPEV